jgi:hypothetical protein
MPARAPTCLQDDVFSPRGKKEGRFLTIKTRSIDNRSSPLAGEEDKKKTKKGGHDEDVLLAIHRPHQLLDR